MKIILLGGVPGSGKTTISYALAIKYNICTILNVDTIKQTIKLFVDEEEEKYLYTTSHEANKVESLQIISAYKKHADVINNYLDKLLSNIKDKIVIIEGVTINKKLYKELSKNNEVLYMNMSASKEELVKRYEKRKRIRYGNWINNIDIIETMNNYFMKNCEINIISNGLKRTLKEVNVYVKNFLYDQS